METREPTDIQHSHTSNRLQALAHVGMEIQTPETKDLKPTERLAHLKEAARLYPDSPEVYGYLSYQLDKMGGTAGAKAVMNRANGRRYQRVVALLEAQTAEMQVQRAQK